MREPPKKTFIHGGYTVPANQPAIGETWLSTAVDGTRSFGVVVEIDVRAQRAILMGRAGRTVAVNLNIMRLNWKYAVRPHEGPCAKACSNPAVVRNLQGEWVCLEHTTRNQGILLPGDSVPNGVISDTHCPACDRKVDGAAYSAFYIAEEFLLNRCPCGAQWCILRSMNAPGDGAYLVKSTAALLKLFKKEPLDLAIVAGFAAMTKVRNEIRVMVSDARPDMSSRAADAHSLDHMYTFERIPVYVDPAYLTVVSDTLMVIGVPTLKGVQHGAEYDGPNKVTGIVKGVDFRGVTIEGPQGQFRARRNTFHADYKRIVRRSRLDILLDDRDLV